MSRKAYRATRVNDVDWDRLARGKEGLDITLGVDVGKHSACFAMQVPRSQISTSSSLERLKKCLCHRNHIHMRAEANETKASWTGPSRSVRNRSLRKLCSHDKVRSATQR